MYEYLKECFEKDPQKHYHLIDDKIYCIVKIKSKNKIKIAGSFKVDMVFFVNPEREWTKRTFVMRQ